MSHPRCCLDYCCAIKCKCSDPNNMFYCCFYSNTYDTDECNKPEGCQNTCLNDCCDHCPETKYPLNNIMNYFVEGYLDDTVITIIFKDKDEYNRLKLEYDFFSNLEVFSKGRFDGYYFYDESSDEQDT